MLKVYCQREHWKKHVSFPWKVKIFRLSLKIPKVNDPKDMYVWLLCILKILLVIFWKILDILNFESFSRLNFVFSFFWYYYSKNFLLVILAILLVAFRKIVDILIFDSFSWIASPFSFSDSVTFEAILIHYI